RSLACRVVEHVPQQKDRALRRSQGLQGEEEREGHALEQVVAGGGISALVRGLVRGRLALDRRRQPLSLVPAAPTAAPQQIAAEVDGDAHEPGPPGAVAVRGRPLESAHEALLDDVVGVRGVAGEAVAQPPEEGPMLREDGPEVRGHAPTQAAEVARVSRARMAEAAARALPRLASASRPSAPTQSPATYRPGTSGTSGPGR